MQPVVFICLLLALVFKTDAQRRCKIGSKSVRCCRQYCRFNFNQPFSRCFSNCRANGILPPPNARPTQSPTGRCTRNADCLAGTCCGIPPHTYCTATPSKSVVEGGACRCDDECDYPIDDVNFANVCKQGTCVLSALSESPTEHPSIRPSGAPSTKMPTKQPTVSPTGSCSTDSDCSGGTACCGSDAFPNSKFCSDVPLGSRAPGEHCTCNSECADDLSAALGGVCDQGTCVQQNLTCNITTDCFSNYGLNGTCCNGICTSIAPASLPNDQTARCSCTDECVDPYPESGYGYCDLNWQSGVDMCRIFCLAADSIVTIVRRGKEMDVKLNETVRGDQILVANEETGEMFFDDILLFHHFGRDSGRTGFAEVNVIEWEEEGVFGKKSVTRDVKITDGHLIYVDARRGGRKIRDAKDVVRGDRLFVGHEGSLKSVVVTNVRREVTQIANVVTRHGNYLANGVLVSSHMGNIEEDHRLKTVVFGVYFDLLPKLIWWEEDLDFFDYEWLRVSLRAILYPIARVRWSGVVLDLLSS